MARSRVKSPKALTPARFGLLRELLARGLAAADIAVQLKVDVESVTEWTLIVDGPGPLDLAARRDEGGLEVALGTTTPPEPSQEETPPASEAGHAPHRRWRLLSRRAQRGRRV